MASFLLPIIAACHIRASNALLNIVILLGRDVCVQPESVISTGGRRLQVQSCRLQVKGCRFQENSRNSPPGVQPRPTKRRAFASSGVLVLGAWLSSRNSPPGITTPAYKDVAVYCSRGRWPRGFFRTPASTRPATKRPCRALSAVRSTCMRRISCGFWRGCCAVARRRWGQGSEVRGSHRADSPAFSERGNSKALPSLARCAQHKAAP